MLWTSAGYHPKDQQSLVFIIASSGVFGQLRHLLYLGCLEYYLSATPGIYRLGVKIRQGALQMRNMTRMWPGAVSMCLQASPYVLGWKLHFSIIAIDYRFCARCFWASS